MILASIHLERSGYLWALAALGAVYLLHLLRLHVRSQRVAGYDLWMEVARQTPRVRLSALAGLNAPLVFRLFLIAFTCLALAQPVSVTSSPGAEVVLVFDLGASMAGRDASGKTRLERAGGEALRLMDFLPETARIRLMPVAPEAEGLKNGSADLSPKDFKKALVTLRPSPSPTSTDDVRPLALSMAGRPRTQVFVFTDKALDFSDQPSALRPVVIRSADREPNAGIASISVDTESGQVLVGVARKAGGAERVEIVLEIKRNGKAETRSLQLIFPPGRDYAAQTMGPLPLQDIESIIARIPARDSLEADNEATLERRADATLDITLIGDIGQAVESACRAIDGTKVSRSYQVEPETDIALYGSIVPEDNAKRAPVSILVNPPGPFQSFVPEQLSTVQVMPVYLLSEAGKELIGFDPTGAQLPVRQTIRPREGVVPLLGNGDKIVVATGRGDARTFFIGLDVSDQAAWTGEPLFPLFWMSVLETARGKLGATRDWVGRGVLSLEATSSSGEPIPFDPSSVRLTELTEKRSLDWVLVICLAGVVCAYWWLSRKP